MKRNDGNEQKDWSAADVATFEEADGKADYDKCVEISTKASIREMVLPGLLAVSAPVAVGFLGGAEMLGGLLSWCNCLWCFNGNLPIKCWWCLG